MTLFIIAENRKQAECSSTDDWLKRCDIYIYLNITQPKKGFQGGTNGKIPPASGVDIRDLGSIPRLGILLGGGHGNPLQYSWLQNPIAWQAMIHRVTESIMTEVI